jgi:hypothetical protein
VKWLSDRAPSYCRIQDDLAIMVEGECLDWFTEFSSPHSEQGTMGDTISKQELSVYQVGVSFRYATV